MNEKERLATIIENRRIHDTTWDHDFDWMIHTIEQLQEDNNRYKDINQGLLEVQFDLRDKNNEYEQWFRAASENVQNMQTRIQELETIEKAYEALKKAL